MRGGGGQELINIIIPVYNVEKYLRKCLNSVRKQTYKNIEVILVDDGSQDKSPQICDEYANKDARFKVIHKQNGGASSARNAGLDRVASNAGKYVMFVDSDDWLPYDAVEALTRTRRRTAADFVCGSFTSICPTKNLKTVHSEDCFDKNDSKFYSFMMLAATHRIHALWGKLYGKQLIVENNIRFDTKIKTGEDALFQYQYIQCCNKFATTSECVYYYNLLNASSLSHTYYPERNMFKKTFLIERQKCFENKLPETYYCENNDFTLLVFNAIVRRYVSDLSKQEAVDKIHETYALFKELLDNIIIDETPRDEFVATKRYLKYEPLLKAGKYNQVYDFFCKRNAPLNDAADKVRSKIKSIMAKIRVFILFELP